MKLVKLILFSIIISAGHSNLNAEEVLSRSKSENITHLDIFLGVVNPTGESSNLISSRVGYGAQLLFELAPDFALGAFYSAHKGSAKHFDAIDIKMSYFGLVGQLNLTPTFFIQGKAAFSTIQVTTTDPVTGQTATIKASKHPFVLGLGVGANFPIANNVSFAPTISYAHSFKTAGGSDKIEAAGLVEVMMAIRFNF